MTKSLAIAVIHGMGSHGAKRPKDSACPSFSRDLHKRIRKEIGKDIFDTQIAWREVFWSDILQTRQDAFLQRIKRRTNYDILRSFVVHNLGDAAGYQYAGPGAGTTYMKIHARISQTITALKNDTQKEAPLLVLAHSLGGHIMSNYIYDMTKAPIKPTQNFQQLRTMAGFITFGCNIPLYTFTHDEKKIIPIKFPGTSLPPARRHSPWWLNYYDRDDVLGFPLAKISPQYQVLADKGGLKEVAINAGTLLESWNPTSHNGYWRDDDFYKPVARFMKKFL